MAFSYQIEIQRSRLGTIGHAHWHLVTVLSPSPGTSPSLPAPLSFEDYGVLVNESYFYRARWTLKDLSIGTDIIAVGQWTTPMMVTIRDNRAITLVGSVLDSELILGYEENNMSGIVTPSGAQSRLAFALQADYDTAAEGTHLAEYRSGGANANRMIAYSTALRDTPSQRIKGQVTDFEANGNVVIELTPEGTLPLLLTALFGAPTTTAYYADVTGSPTTWSSATTYAANAKVKRGSYYYTSVGNGNLNNKPECDAAGTYWTLVPDVTSGLTANFRCYKHVWKHLWDMNYISMHHYKGTTVESFVRGMATSLSIGVNRTAREVITGSVDLRFANQFIADDWENVVDSAAGYDTLPPWTASVGKVLINGVVGANFREFSGAVSRQISDKFILNGKLGPAGFSNSGSDTSGSMVAYFDDETHLQRFMGYSSAYTKPAGFTGDLIYADIQSVLEYNTPGSVDSPLEYGSKLVVRFPRALYGAVSQPIAGREQITQSITIEPCLDSTLGTDVVYEVWNRQARSSIIATGSAITVPCSAVE